ncbi:MAG: 16S rRNA (cytidine(1402)-2'-O)-methyltransferase [Chthoniobacterales bacterium]
MLTIVPTPIGNLDDITLRALSALREADVVAAEDTRHSGILLKHHGISKPFVSFHEHNEARRTAELIEELSGGRKVALITDAGMPGVSDPGMRLVRACAEAGVEYTVLPGASAVVTAVVGSGFDATDFSFAGFLPVKSGQRRNALEAALAGRGTAVFFESPHRLVKSLAVLAEVGAERRVCVARELTKKFEEYRIGLPAELLRHYEERPPKGEICLVLEGKDVAARRAKAAARID